MASSSSFRSMPPTSSVSCSGVVALAIGPVMPGRRAIQASATWAGVAPSRAATLSTAARTAEAVLVHVALLDARGAAALRQLGARLVLPGQEAARQRRVGDDADLVPLAERFELALVVRAVHRW